ncbi:MAG: ribonuclease Z [Sinomicrobium sp.]|nr:ribonuclease Z [Sinomicrobium sp.]
MIFDKQGSVTVITRESVSLTTFLDRLHHAYNELKHENLIVNLFSLQKVTPDDLLLFLDISNMHRKQKKSFVIVTGSVNYDQIPDELIVAPTLQEAQDIIEMEEMERDLGF